MNLSPDEAEDALTAIQLVTQKTRHAIANSGVYLTLLVTGVVWLVGYACTQFISGPILAYIWIALSLGGTAAATIWGRRLSGRVRSSSAGETARRLILFWLFLVLFCAAAIAVARPAEGKQVAMFIILFNMIGQLAMGLLLSFNSTWWALPVAALALLGYFLLPGIFYLWVGILGGGGMIAFALYMRSRW